MWFFFLPCMTPLTFWVWTDKQQSCNYILHRLVWVNLKPAQGTVVLMFKDNAAVRSGKPPFLLSIPNSVSASNSTQKASVQLYCWLKKKDRTSSNFLVSQWTSGFWQGIKPTSNSNASATAAFMWKQIKSLPELKMLHVAKSVFLN